MGGAGASDARERPWPFSVVRASDADAFVDALGGDATRVLTRAEDVKKYSVDWMGKYVGASAVVVWGLCVDSKGALTSFVGFGCAPASARARTASGEVATKSGT